jgi:hypothetical protein
MPQQKPDRSFAMANGKERVELFEDNKVMRRCYATISARTDCPSKGPLEYLGHPTACCLVQPQCVPATNENWDVASERGEWVERWTEKDGITELRGSYLGLWSRESGQWREGDEILVRKPAKEVRTAANLQPSNAQREADDFAPIEVS